MALGADDGESACGLDVVAELDVGTASGHVGGDGHGAEQALLFVAVAVGVGDGDLAGFALSGLGHDVGFLLVELGVEDVVGDVAEL